MIVRLYAVYDRAAMSFMQPIPVQSDAIMRRHLEALVASSPDAPHVKYPADHDVYYIGDYDDTTGMISPAVPVLVFRFVDFVEAK